MRRTKILIYVNENEFNKKMRALKHYLMRSYKYICFKMDYEKDFSGVKGKHELEIPTDNNFKKVYGQVKIIYRTCEEGIIIEDLEPRDILKACHEQELKTFMGVPVRDDRDKFRAYMILGR